MASELDARSYELAHKEDLLEQVRVKGGEWGSRSRCGGRENDLHV